MKADFTKGIHTNTKPVNTPPGYYRDAENMRVTGNAKRTEEGNVQTSVPSNFVEWGSCAIGQETILLGTLDGKSIIGSLDIEGNWAVEVPVRAGTDVLGIVDPTQVEGKKNWAAQRVIYFSTPSGSRRINLGKFPGDVILPAGDDDFDKVTSLFLEYDLPRTNYVGESNSGELLTGVYQFAARLVTESGASTSFGIISGVIPIVDASINSSRYVVEGDPPQTQTTKAINLVITNVDTAFKYIELGVLTYVGASNTQKITRTTQILINDQSTVNYTYRGAPDDFGVLTTEEFIVSGVAYTTAKYLAQKDGTLLLGSPVEAEQPPINWFRVAENMTAKYVIKKIPFEESLNFEGSSYTAYVYPSGESNFRMVETSDPQMNPENEGYHDPTTCVLYKGYRRGETYAFSITPVFTSGVYGPTIHIPGPPPGTQADGVDQLGSYVSEERYTDDRYPNIPVNDGIRHFKMPDAKLQPIIEGNVETANCYIRVLGIKFENIALDPSEVQYSDQISGYIISRGDRRGQETQLAQGIVRPNTDTSTNNAGWTDIRTITCGDGYGTWARDTRNTQSWDMGTEDASFQSKNDFTFVSPDLIHNLYSPQLASHIQQHSVYTSKPYSAPFNFGFAGGNHVWDNTGTPSRHRCGFHNITGLSSFDFSTEKTQLDGDPKTVQPFGVPARGYNEGGRRPVGLQKGSKVLQVCSTNGFVWFETLNGVDIKFEKTVGLDPDKYRFYRDFQQAIERGGSDDDYNDSWVYLHGDNFEARFILHTLTRENTKQYGPLDQMVSMFVDYKDWTGEPTQSAEVFNGDTFINKYGLKASDEAAHPWDQIDGDKDDHEGKHNLRAHGMDILVYMWLESDNNYAYRHFIESSSYAEDNISGETGTMPFFPSYKQLGNLEVPFGLLSMDAENWQTPGYCKGYNTQYSTQPTIKPYVNTPVEDVEQKGSLVNRILYSTQAVQGEKTDGYQIFLPNNYYDVPQEFGELTDVYVNHELYASTPQVQWKLFFNTLATQTTSAGEVVLGTGGAFNRPAVPMSTVDGGYGGTTHWLHAMNSVWGRVFIDQRQGKFFLMTDNLASISGDLDDKLRLEIQSLPNTYNSAESSILVGIEPLRERAMLKIGGTMYSYNLERRMFVSRQTWTPRWFFAHGPHMYTNTTTSEDSNKRGIFKHGIGPTGMFYGDLHKSSITIVGNGENTVSKLYQSMEIQTKRITEEGLNIPFHTWDQMEKFNEERYTGLIDINPQLNTFQIPAPMEVLSSKVKDCFRVIVPRDIVIDPAVDIFAFANHAQHRGDLTLTPWLPKMRGTYMELKLITDNTQGPLFFYDLTWKLSENIR